MVPGEYRIGVAAQEGRSDLIFLPYRVLPGGLSM